jgi:hypothetical protein
MPTTTLCRCLLPLLALAAFPLVAQDSPDPAAARRTALERAGVGAPVVLWPVRLLGRPSGEVADALGLLLERQGMPSLEPAGGTFDAKQLAWDAVPAAFGAEVRAAAARGLLPKGAYSLYAELLGDPKTGPTEVRFVVVDAAGDVVLVDRQTPQDPTFRRTAGADPDPLGCVACVAERLFEHAGWRQVKGGVREGRFEAMWQRKSGMPDRQQRAAMQQRAASLRQQLASAEFALFAPPGPPAAAFDPARFAAELQRQLGCKAVVPTAGQLVVAPAANQQKRLYDLAAAAGKAQRQPGAAGYAIAVDFAIDADGKRGYANVVVLDQAGELVLAEYVNDQHALFQQQAAKGPVHGEALAAGLLVRALR